MPDYEIEDTQTGLKLVVTGNESPSLEDAEELFAKEFNDIRTNLVELPDGKFYLDVGPLQENRAFLDTHKDAYSKSKSIDDRHNSAKHYADEMFKKDFDAWNKKPSPRGEGPDWRKYYDNQLARFGETNKVAVPKSVSEKVMANHPPGTLYINAHGSQKNKNLSTQWGHEFTLNNIAKLLGQKASAVRNIVNASCYGASCEPKDYESAFPALSSLSHINTNFSNIISIEGQQAGKDFSADRVDWTKDPQLGWSTKYQYPAASPKIK